MILRRLLIAANLEFHTAHIRVGAHTLHICDSTHIETPEYQLKKISCIAPIQHVRVVHNNVTLMIRLLQIMGLFCRI